MAIFVFNSTIKFEKWEGINPVKIFYYIWFANKVFKNQKVGGGKVA
jgi:hypothetical protein